MPFKDKEFAKEYHKQKSRDWMRQNRLENLEKYKERERLFRENNPAKRLIYSTKQSARLKGLEHNITEEDLLCPELCPYLKVKIDYRAGIGKQMLNPSVDRIDPTLGYIKGNVEVISNMANTMKLNATREQLLEFAKTIQQRYGEATQEPSGL